MKKFRWVYSGCREDIGLLTTLGLRYSTYDVQSGSSEDFQANCAITDFP